MQKEFFFFYIKINGSKSSTLNRYLRDTTLQKKKTRTKKNRSHVKLNETEVNRQIQVSPFPFIKSSPHDERRGKRWCRIHLNITNLAPLSL